MTAISPTPNGKFSNYTVKEHAVSDSHRVTMGIFLLGQPQARSLHLSGNLWELHLPPSHIELGNSRAHNVSALHVHNLSRMCSYIPLEVGERQ